MPQPPATSVTSEPACEPGEVSGKAWAPNDAREAPSTAHANESLKILGIVSFPLSGVIRPKCAAWTISDRKMAQKRLPLVAELRGAFMAVWDRTFGVTASRA